MSGRDGLRRTLAAFGVVAVVAVLVSGPAGAEPGRRVPVGVPLPPPVPMPVPAAGTFDDDCPGD